MTLKNNIRASLLYYPVIFVNALDVLHHLFCVNGNGFEWLNGELVECGGCERSISVKDAIDFHIANTLGKGDIYSTIDTVIFRHDIDKKFPDYQKLSRELSDKLIKDLTRSVNMTLDIEHRVNDFSIATLKDYPDSFTCMIRERNKNHPKNKMFAWRLYPLSEHSGLCTIPDDVKEDYLKGAEWMIEFIKSHPDVHRESDYERNMEWIKTAEERIAGIRKARVEEKEED